MNSPTSTVFLALLSRIANLARANKSSHPSVCWAVEWVHVKFAKAVFTSSGRIWAIYISLVQRREQNQMKYLLLFVLDDLKRKIIRPEVPRTGGSVG